MKVLKFWISCVVAFVFFTACKSNSNLNSDEAEAESRNQEEISDVRIIGTWYVYGFNDELLITEEEILINDGKGNNYPSGVYKLKKVSGAGGKGEILIDGVNEGFDYEFEDDVIILNFLRIGFLKCSRDKW